MIIFEQERTNMKRILIVFALLFCFFDGYNQDIDFMENRIEQLSLTPWEYPDSILYYSESLLKLDPLNETAIENYIWVLGFEGKYVEQIHFLDEIISLDSTNVKYHIERGIYTLNTFNDTSGFSDLKWALIHDSTEASMLFGIGSFLFNISQDKHDSLFIYYRYDIAEYPPALKSRLEREKILYEAEACKYLEKAIEKDPVSRTAIKRSLIIIYKRQARFAEADFLENTTQLFNRDKSYMPVSPLQLYFPEGTFLDTVNTFNDNPKDSVYFEDRFLFAGHENSYYSDELYNFKEPLLPEQNDKIIFRFLWLRSFHEPVVIRLEKHNDKQYLIRKVREGMSGYQAGGIIINDTLMISNSLWDDFISVLDSSDYWETPTIEKTNALVDDGAHWILEGKQNERYHIVDRHSPSIYNNPKYRELCLYIIELSQLFDTKEDVY